MDRAGSAGSYTPVRPHEQCLDVAANNFKDLLRKALIQGAVDEHVVDVPVAMVVDAAALVGVLVAVLVEGGGHGGPARAGGVWLGERRVVLAFVGGDEMRRAAVQLQ